MLVPLDPLIDVVGLKLGEQLDNSSLELGLGHQYLVLWDSEPFRSHLDPVDRLHPESDLILLLRHELPTEVLSSIFAAALVEDKNIALLGEFDLIEHLK